IRSKSRIHQTHLLGDYSEAKLPAEVCSRSQFDASGPPRDAPRGTRNTASVPARRAPNLGGWPALPPHAHPLVLMLAPACSSSPRVLVLASPPELGGTEGEPALVPGSSPPPQNWGGLRGATRKIQDE